MVRSKKRRLPPKQKIIAIRVDEQIAKDFKAFCDEQKTSMTAVLRLCILDYLIESGGEYD